MRPVVVNLLAGEQVPDQADRLLEHLQPLRRGRPAAETVRMVQSLVSSFSEDELRDDLTILVARVKAPPEATGPS